MASLKLQGSTSGEITISAPAVAGTNTLTLPTKTGTIGLYAAPQVTVLTSGTGTYTTPTGAAYLIVEVIGGGAGGAGGGYSTDGTAGGNGGATTFGTSLLTANGGTGNRTGSFGGSATIGAGATGIAQTGNAGDGFDAYNDTTFFGKGGIGGAGVYGGCGYGGANAAGTNAKANSGAGGGGGGAGTAATLKYTGGGGGAGGYIKAWITSPSASYSYAVGAGGTAGTAGTNGYDGGTGGSGLIIVTAYFG